MAKCLIECPHCGHSANVNEEILGKKTKCPKCDRIFVIQKKQVSQINTVPDCKEKTVIDKVVTAQCPKCGKEIARNAKICKHCKESLSDSPLKQIGEFRIEDSSVTMLLAALIHFLTGKKIVDQIDEKCQKAFAALTKSDVIIGLAVSIMCFGIYIAAPRIIYSIYEPATRDKFILFIIIRLIFILYIASSMLLGLLSTKNFRLTLRQWLSLVLILVILYYIPNPHYLFRVLTQIIIFFTTVLMSMQNIVQSMPLNDSDETPAADQSAESQAPTQSWSTKCPYCNTLFYVQESWEGKKTTCTECRKNFTIHIES